MQITPIIVRVFTVVALVAAVGAGTARASSSQPAAMTAAEYEALMVRSEGVKERYGNVVTRLSPAEFKALYDAGGYKLEPQELVALVERSEALNRAHVTPAAVATGGGSAGSSFFAGGVDWGDFGTGAAGALGLALLAGGLVAAGRHARRARVLA